MSALRELIDEWNGTPPITVAVTGWRRADKPPIADLLSQSPHIVCSFNAFEAEGEPYPPGARLAAAVARTAGPRRRWWRRVFQPISTEMSPPRTRWWRRLSAAGLSAVLAAVVVALPGVQDLAVSLANQDGVIGKLAGQAERTPLAPIAIVAALFWFVAVRTWNATTAVARFASSARDAAAKGSITEVRGELNKLIGRALRNRRRFVVVIENLDRCAGDFALSLCEAAAKLLRRENVILILLGDLGTMEEAANRKFELPAGAPDADLRGRQHIRDLIPLILALPPPERRPAT